jgi:F-type H+-transporting ATPase subunit gamma
VAAEGEARKGPVQVVDEYVGLLNRVKFESANKVAEFVIGRYAAQSTDAVHLVYNEFKSVISQRLVTDQVLPVEHIGEVVHEATLEISEEARKHDIEAALHAGVGVRPADTRAIDQKAAAFGTSQVDYIYEQPPRELFGDLLPKYVSVQLFRAMLESEAAEHAARMTAMDAATNNAVDMIDDLTLAMNRARQAKITREIIEIVSGAAAL